MSVPFDRRRLRRRLQRAASTMVGNGFFRGLSRAGRLHPLSRPEAHNVELIRDVPYRASGLPEHQLDIYRPMRHPGPWPVVLYVHGGGFRLLSKETHWVMGLAFARHGYLVVNISYRLAPQHPFPAAIDDVCEALAWVARHAREYGGDPDRLVFAGESAGANLVTALTVATCYERDEPYARRAWDTGLVPSAVVPACGLLQVSDAARFGRRRKLPTWVNGMLREIGADYLRGEQDASALDLADPLLVFERGDRPHRPLPPFFVPVGTRDPILDDTRRLAAALDAMRVPCEARYYEGEVHAFHAMVWTKNARRCWRDTFAFLDRHMRPAVAAPIVRSTTG